MTTTTGTVWPRLNGDLLDRVLAHITAHPEQHDQVWWVMIPGRETLDEWMAVLGGMLDYEDLPCGTTACIAGWTALLTDATWVSPSAVQYDPSIDRADDEHAAWGLTYYGASYSGRVPIAARAARLLGLTYTESRALFIDSRDVRGTVDAILAGEFRDGHPPLCTQGDRLCADCAPVADRDLTRTTTP